MVEETTKDTTQLQAVADLFYMMMGQCIAEWARIEDQLFQIFHAALECPKVKAAIVFFRLSQLEAKLTLTTELVESALPEHKPGEQLNEGLKLWKRLDQAIREKLPVRNQIAPHSVAMRHEALVANNRGENVLLESWFHIYESRNQRLRGRRQKDDLFLSDLRSYLINTSQVSTSLHGFYHQTLQKHVSVPPPR